VHPVSSISEAVIKEGDRSGLEGPRNWEKSLLNSLDSPNQERYAQPELPRGKLPVPVRHANKKGV